MTNGRTNRPVSSCRNINDITSVRQNEALCYFSCQFGFNPNEDYLVWISKLPPISFSIHYILINNRFMLVDQFSLTILRCLWVSLISKHVSYKSIRFVTWWHMHNKCLLLLFYHEYVKWIFLEPIILYHRAFFSYVSYCAICSRL